MNQTKKRLSIINLAISITDIETIQLQILQLSPLRADEKIQEILTTLKAENYAQAQGLIATYIETPTKEILQRTFQKDKIERSIEDNNVIDDFNLFVESEEDEESKTMDLDEMLAFSDEMINDQKRNKEENEKKERDDFANLQLDVEPKESNNFDAILNIDEDDVLANNIDIDISHNKSKTFWDEPVKFNFHDRDIEKDTFFDAEKSKPEPIEEPIDQETFNTNDISDSNTSNIEEKNIEDKKISEELAKRMHTEEKEKRDKNHKTFH